MVLEFILASLLLAIMPGTALIYIVVMGLSRGFVASLCAATGCVLAIIPAALVSVVGLSAILHADPLLFQVVRVLGLLYLAYVVFHMLRCDSLLNPQEHLDRSGLASIVITGALLNVLNPKLVLFLFAFLPQFLPQQADNPRMMFMVLSLIFASVSFTVFVACGALAARGRGYLLGHPKMELGLRLCCAGALACLCIHLALSS